ncbi:anaerobic C4-dicarboxylate transporter family protein [Bacillus shihchuchen]
MFWLQFLTLLLCIFIGARLGGVGLGVMGGVGMAILVFVFHLQPTAPPIDVMLMILAVITAAGALKPLEEWTTLFIWLRKHYEKSKTYYILCSNCYLFIYTLCRNWSRCLFCTSCYRRSLSRIRN